MVHCQRRASAASVVPPASRSSASTSSLSRIEKLRLQAESPRRRSRSSARPSAWKVLIASVLGSARADHARWRARASPAAALLVNVMAAICSGACARVQQARDLVHDDAGLARAGAGQHQARPLGVPHGLPLRWIEMVVAAWFIGGAR